MSFAEKMDLLETVWSEISSEPENIEVPQWHKDILDEREEALNSGQEEVIDWAEAKAQILRGT
jgi:hypothetical protein